jgi:hypothetical protein
MHQSFYLDCGNNSLVTGSAELIDYLKNIGADFEKIDSMGFRVNGPQSVLSELHEASASISFPFFDPSH